MVKNDMGNSNPGDSQWDHFSLNRISFVPSCDGSHFINYEWELLKYQMSKKRRSVFLMTDKDMDSFAKHIKEYHNDEYVAQYTIRMSPATWGQVSFDRSVHARISNWTIWPQDIDKFKIVHDERGINPTTFSEIENIIIEWTASKGRIYFGDHIKTPIYSLCPVCNFKQKSKIEKYIQICQNCNSLYRI